MSYYTKQRIRMFLSGLLLTPGGAFCLCAGLGFFDDFNSILMTIVGAMMLLMGIGSFHYAFVEVKKEEQARHEDIRKVMEKEERVRSISERIELEKELSQKPDTNESFNMLRKLFDDGILTSDEYLQKLKELWNNHKTCS